MPFLAFLLPFCQRLMPLLAIAAVRQTESAVDDREQIGGGVAAWETLLPAAGGGKEAREQEILVLGQPEPFLTHAALQVRHRLSIAFPLHFLAKAVHFLAVVRSSAATTVHSAQWRWPLRSPPLSGSCSSAPVRSFLNKKKTPC